MKFLIIIPAYNEEHNIAHLLEQLESSGIPQEADILVIDDGSTDHTYEAAAEKNCTVIRHVYNLGYGCALQTGFKYAVQEGYTYVIQMDADGQHDICNIHTVYKALRTKDREGKYPDIVLGSRFLKESESYPVGMWKRTAIRLFRGIIGIATGASITDPTTGLQGLNQRTVEYYAGYEHFDDRYPDTNMLIQMLLLGFRVREIPAVMHPRNEGNGMHAGIIKPVLYMMRMAFSMMAVWGRIKILKLDKEVGNED